MSNENGKVGRGRKFGRIKTSNGGLGIQCEVCKKQYSLLGAGAEMMLKQFVDQTQAVLGCCDNGPKLFFAWRDEETEEKGGNDEDGQGIILLP